MRPDVQRFRFATLVVIACAGLSGPAMAEDSFDWNGGRRTRIEPVLWHLEHGRPLTNDRSVLEREAEKLRAEGPEILPILTAQLSRLNGAALAAAADILREGCYEAAIPGLLAALDNKATSYSISRASFANMEPQESVQKALMAMARPEDVPLIAARLFDPQATRSREFLVSLLAKIDTPEAYAALRHFYGKDSPDRWRWWSPPDPKILLKNSSCHDLAASAVEARKSQKTYHCNGDAALVPRPDANPVVVFLDGYLGDPLDLWAAEVTVNGVLPAVFLGTLEKNAWSRILTAWPDGDLLVVGGSERPNAMQRMDPILAVIDTDNDGLADKVEEKLGLNPLRADTDSDGLIDPEDGTPIGRSHRVRSDQEEIALAILRHVHPSSATSEGRSRTPILQADIELNGLGGETFAGKPAEEIAQFLHLSLITGWRYTEAEQKTPLLPGEIRYELTRDYIGYRITVRKYRDLWIVTGFKRAWIA